MPDDATHPLILARHLASLLLLASLAACGDPCRTEIERTREAMRKAREARADVYSPNHWKKAQDLAEQAETACQKNRFGRLFARSRRETEDLHRQAQKEAGDAIAEARAMEGMLRQEALNVRYSAGMAIQEARVASLSLLKHPEEAKAREIELRLKDLERRLAELQSEIDRGDYLDAREKGAELREEAVALGATDQGPPTRRKGE